MNIFILDLDFKTNAKYHNNKHCVKMILEQIQLLCSAHYMLESNIDKTKIYRLTHKNHPCSIWVRQSLNNYKWLLNSTKELLNEYTYRYGKNT